MEETERLFHFSPVAQASRPAGSAASPPLFLRSSASANWSLAHRLLIILSTLPLALDFIKKNRAGGRDVGGVGAVMHRNGRRFSAGAEDFRRDTVTFGAEDKATIAREVEVGDGFSLCMRMGRDDTNVRALYLLQCRRQV